MLSEQLQKQIEQEAKKYAEKRHNDLTDKKHLHRKTLLMYAHMEGATKYAKKWQEAQQRAERYEKALKQIEQMSDPGDYWKAICDMKAIASDALTPKTGSDE